MAVIILFLCAFVTGSFYLYYTKRNPRVLGVAEMVEMDIPEWYLEPLVVSRGNSILSVTPMAGKRVPVEREGERHIYRDAYPNTDVAHTEYSFKIKEEMIFKRPGHPIKFQYRIGNIDKYYIVRDKGNIIFYDKELYDKGDGGNELSRVFTIPAPFVEDSQHYRLFDVVQMVIEEDLLIITVDEDYFKDARYPVTLDPTIEINVLNVHSHPRQGDNWEVSFTTQGQADLKIIPDDQATIDDDEFVSLWCDEEKKTPEILENDVVYYPDWSCVGVGRVIHYTKKAGKHTLKFDFGGQIAYVYNDPADPWWDADFIYRKEITINASEVEYDGYFPILATTTDSSLKFTGYGGHVASSTGGDIAFTDGNNSRLDYEREYYASTTGEIAAWVRVNLSSSADTKIYLYYGNYATTTDQALVNPTGVWDSNFKGVWHLNNASDASSIDSTANSNNGDMTGPPTATSTEHIDGALDFNGTDNYVDIADDDTLDVADITLSAWVKTDTGGRYIIAKDPPAPGKSIEPAGDGFGVAGLPRSASVATMAKEARPKGAPRNDREFMEPADDFSKGVLTINTDKSIYLPNEQAYLQMAALRDDGHTICDANLKLDITAPDGQAASPDIQLSGKCGPNNVTDAPDYFSYYRAGEAGIYKMTLTNLDNGHEVSDFFEVRDIVPFEIERTGPTRIYPPADYEMKMNIKVNEDFRGSVVETVPDTFKIINPKSEILNPEKSLRSNGASKFKIQNTNVQNEKLLIWQIDWRAEEEYNLQYTFNAPDISPYVYSLGPLIFLENTTLEETTPQVAFKEARPAFSETFSEARQWQVAADSIAFVNEVHGYSSSGATSIAAAAGNHTSGNLLVVLVSGWNEETVSSVTDTAGNTYYWTGQRSPYVHRDKGFTEIWYAKDITGHASNVVTVHYSGSVTYRELSVHQYSGADPSDPYDVGNTGSATSGTFLSTAASTTTQDNEVIVAVYAMYETGTCTAGEGFTIRRDGTYFGSEDRIVSSIGSYGSSMTYSDNDDWTGSHATFKAAAVAPTIETHAATGTTDTAATLNATTTATGGANLTARGFAVGTTADLSGGDTATTTESGDFGAEDFFHATTTLAYNTTYYFRAYGTNSGGTGYGNILSFTTALKTVPYALSIDSGNKAVFEFISNGNIYSATSTTSVNDNKWHHIVATYDGSSIKMHVDGSLEDTNTDPSEYLPANNGNVRIGADYEIIPGNFFNGLIDEARIATSARSLTWIQTEYNNQSAVGTFLNFGVEEELPSTPTITSVSAPSARSGADITFTVDWNDANAGEQIKAKICSTNSLTGTNCTASYYASSSAFTTSNPELISTTTLASWEGTNDFWAFVCDDDSNCSQGYYGHFYVGYVTEITTTGNMIINSPITGYYTGGLVGHWTFNGPDMDWGANLAYDRSGQGNNGTLIKMSTTSSPAKGISGQALDFDGVDDYVEIEDSASITFANSGDDQPMSVVAWIYLDSNTNKQRFVGKADALDDGEYLLTTTGSDVFGFVLIDQSVSNFIGRSWSTIPSLGRWYHLVGTYNGDNTSSGVRLYVDGVRRDDTDLERTPYSGMENTNKKLQLGKYGSDYFDGKIDEVRVYNYVLATSTIVDLYNVGARRMRVRE